jgi:hypothetical protein
MIGSTARNAVITGIAAGITIMVVAVLMSFTLPNREREALERIADSNSHLAASGACALAAPIEDVVLANGERVSHRPEWFVNRACLIAFGFEPADLDFDGRIETQRPN